MGRVLGLAMTVVLVLSFAGCTKSDEYEVIESTQNQVPNFQGDGTHTEVHLVLLNDSHKIYAACDANDWVQLNPTATSSFRQLRKYKYRLRQAGDKALSDLRCKDADGNNLYLYVSKKE
jgi:hypothetical protein